MDPSQTQQVASAALLHQPCPLFPAINHSSLVGVTHCPGCHQTIAYRPAQPPSGTLLPTSYSNSTTSAPTQSQIVPPLPSVLRLAELPPTKKPRKKAGRKPPRNSDSKVNTNSSMYITGAGNPAFTYATRESNIHRISCFDKQIPSVVTRVARSYSNTTPYEQHRTLVIVPQSAQQLTSSTAPVYQGLQQNSFPAQLSIPQYQTSILPQQIGQPLQQSVWSAPQAFQHSMLTVPSSLSSTQASIPPPASQIAATPVSTLSTQPVVQVPEPRQDKIPDVLPKNNEGFLPTNITQELRNSSVVRREDPTRLTATMRTPQLESVEVEIEGEQVDIQAKSGPIRTQSTYVNAQTQTKFAPIAVQQKPSISQAYFVRDLPQDQPRLDVVFGLCLLDRNAQYQYIWNPEEIRVIMKAKQRFNSLKAVLLWLFDQARGVAEADTLAFANHIYYNHYDTRPCLAERAPSTRRGPPTLVVPDLSMTTRPASEWLRPVWHMQDRQCRFSIYFPCHESPQDLCDLPWSGPWNRDPRVAQLEQESPWGRLLESDEDDEDDSEISLLPPPPPKPNLTRKPSNSRKSTKPDTQSKQPSRVKQPSKPARKPKPKTVRFADSHKHQLSTDSTTNERPQAKKLATPQDFAEAEAEGVRAAQAAITIREALRSKRDR